jgi:hypothetical protein
LPSHRLCLTSPPEQTNHGQQEPRRSIPTNPATRPLAVHGFLWVTLASLISLLRLRTEPPSSCISRRSLDGMSAWAASGLSRKVTVDPSRQGFRLGTNYPANGIAIHQQRSCRSSLQSGRMRFGRNRR